MSIIIHTVLWIHMVSVKRLIYSTLQSLILFLPGDACVFVIPTSIECLEMYCISILKNKLFLNEGQGRYLIEPPDGELSVAPTRHRVTCGSKPGVCAIFSWLKAWRHLFYNALVNQLKNLVAPFAAADLDIYTLDKLQIPVVVITLVLQITSLQFY